MFASTEPHCLSDLLDVQAGDPWADQTQKGGFRVLGRFAGQGHRFADELQGLHARSPAVQEELLEKVSVSLREAAATLEVEPLNPISILELAATQDHGNFLRPAISCAMIGLTQLATLWQAVEEFGLGSLHRIRNLFKAGLTGHSQGVIAAVALASAKRRAELLSGICWAVTLLWLLGRQTEMQLQAINMEGAMALIEGPSPDAMLATSVLEAALARLVAASVAGAEDLCIAGRNAPHILVLSGPVSGLEAFRSALEGGTLPELEGSRFRKLRIEAPFHSRHLSGVPEAVESDAAKLGLRLPNCCSLPVISGSGTLLPSEPSAKLLAALVCSEEIDWPGAMTQVADCRFTVEFGPGAPLPLPQGHRLSVFSVAAANQAASSVDAARDAAAETKDKAVAKRTKEAKPVVRWETSEILVDRILGVLAGALGCSNEEVDLDTPFFDLGLRSNDLARFAGALSESFGGAGVAAHELFDYPTVTALVNRLDKQLSSRMPYPDMEEEVVVASDCPDPEDIAGCVLWVIASALNCDREDVEPNVHFELLGLGPDSLKRVAAALAERIHMQVYVEDLTDFPTVSKLIFRLQQRLTGFRNFGPAWGLLAPARVDPGVVERMLVEPCMTLDVVLQVQKKLRKSMAQPDVQADLKRLADTCFPDGEAYLAALHCRVMDEEEKIYKRLGFRNEDTNSLRQKSLRIAAENMKKHPDLRLHSQKLVELTWPSDSDRWKW